MAHLSLLISLLVATTRIGPGGVHASLLFDPLWDEEASQATDEYGDTINSESTTEETANTIEYNELEKEHPTTTPSTIDTATSSTRHATFTRLNTSSLAISEHNRSQHHHNLVELNTLSLAITEQNRSQYYNNFVAFERKSKSYLNNMKSNLLDVLSSYSKSFHREVQQYIMQWPSNKTIEITKLTRETCDCDGARMSPCPLKCLYSCYGWSEWMGINDPAYYEDCRHMLFERCECEMGGSLFSYCDRDRTPENCYSSTTEIIPGDTKCLDHRIDDKNVSKSFEAISAVLVEPIKKHFRGIETELYYLKETAVSVDHLSALVSQMCQTTSSQEEPTCASTALDAMRLEISMYRQIKSNITMKLFGRQKKIRDVYKSFNSLKEQHFTHISESLEKYACCLRATNFTMPDLNCKEPEKPVGICLPGQYTCESGKCIPGSYRCDGGNDCPGGDDERSCRYGR